MGSYRILHIINSVERGGAETLLVNTIEAIKQKYSDCDQYLVTLYKGGALLPKVAPFVTYYNLGLSRYNFPLTFLKLRKLLRTLQVDVVHSHLLHATLISRLALPKGTKLVSTYHSVFYDPSLVDYAKKELFLDKLTYKPSYYTLHVSEAVQQNINASVGIKTNNQVLVNFASPAFQASYTYKADETLRIVMVGNLNPVKNHLIAVQALAKLKDSPITLDIFGEGSLRPELENLIASSGAAVELKGAQAMSSALLSQYDLFLMTSHHEGMPISLLEAMQTGMPSLLNDLPMLRETAADAALYYDYDSLSSLVAGLQGLLNNKSQLKGLSEKALSRAENFSADNYLRQLMRIYKGELETNN